MKIYEVRFKKRRYCPVELRTSVACVPEFIEMVEPRADVIGCEIWIYRVPNKHAEQFEFDLDRDDDVTSYHQIGGK